MGEESCEREREVERERGAYTALDDAAEVGAVPRRVEAFVGAVLAHGADHDAVLHGHAADLERSEELGDWLPVWLGRHCRPGWGILNRRVERCLRGSFILKFQHFSHLSGAVLLTLPMRGL